MSTATLTPSLAKSPVSCAPSFWREMAVLSGLAVVVRLFLGLVLSGPMHGDAADYFHEAALLAKSFPSEAFYWPPGTAYVLSAVFRAFGTSEVAARIAMAVLAGLQAGMMGWLARDLSGSRLAGRLGALIWAVYPPAVLYATQSGSQHLSAFCLTGGVLYAFRSVNLPRLKNVLLCGLMLGLGCLARPSMLSVVAMIPALALWNAWRGPRAVAQVSSLCSSGGLESRPTVQHCLAASAGIIAIVAAVLLPTVVHNVRAGAGPTLSTNNERNFFIGNNPYTPWYKTSHLAQRDLAEHSPEVQEFLKRHYDAENPRAAMKAAAWGHIREEPGLFALRTANRARAFWGFDYLAARTLQQTHQLSNRTFLAALALEAGGYVLVMLLAIAGLVQWRQWKPRLRLWLLVGVGAYAFPYLIAFSAGTYHYPVLGLLIPFAAAALTEGERFAIPWSTFRSRAWLACAAVFLAMQAEYLYFAVRFSG